MSANDVQQDPSITLKIDNYSWDSFKDWKIHKLITGIFRNHLQSVFPEALIRMIHDFYTTELAGSMEVTILKCSTIPNLVSQLSNVRTPSPFVEVWVQSGIMMKGGKNKQIETTNVLLNTSEPEWNETLSFDIKIYGEYLFRVMVRDWNPSLPKWLYYMDDQIPIRSLFNAKSLTIPMKMVDGNGIEESAYSQDVQLTASVCFTADL